MWSCRCRGPCSRGKYPRNERDTRSLARVNRGMLSWWCEHDRLLPCELGRVPHCNSDRSVDCTRKTVLYRLSSLSRNTWECFQDFQLLVFHKIPLSSLPELSLQYPRACKLAMKLLRHRHCGKITKVQKIVIKFRNNCEYGFIRLFASFKFYWNFCQGKSNLNFYLNINKLFHIFYTSFPLRKNYFFNHLSQAVSFKQYVSNLLESRSLKLNIFKVSYIIMFFFFFRFH